MPIPARKLVLPQRLLVALLVVAGTACGTPADEASHGTDDPARQSESLNGGDGARALPAVQNLESRQRLASPPEQAAFKNVLLVTIDTWRYDAAGFAGSEAAHTPTLDQLAADGLQFQRAHALSVLTLPSHANILTGRTPYEHGVRDNAGFFLRKPQVTLAERLREVGYATGAVVGAFPLDSSYGLDQGFQSYDDAFPKGDGVSFSMAERSGKEVVENGLRWWREHADKPRFLWLHLYEPHTPYTPPADALRATNGNGYLAEVAAADSYLEQILQPLLVQSDAASKNTLVIITADHGESLGEHGEATHGLFAYDATLRVPLLLWGSGIEPEVTGEPASHLDIVPTILDGVGLDADPSLPGRSLLSTPSRSAASTYFEALNGTLLRGWAPLRGVVETRFAENNWSAWKYIDLPIPELYDLDQDPKELNNRLPESSDLASQLKAKLPVESQWPPEAGSVSEEERRALESLGYLSGGGPSNVPTEFTVADDPKTLIELDKTLHRFIDLYRTGKLEEATAAARSMVEQRPQMGLAHYHLAQVLLERGLKREALRVLSDAFQAGATTPSLIRQLGLSLAEAGRYDDAIRVLEPLVASGDLETLLAYAQAQTEAGQAAQAKSTLEQVLERDNDNSRAYEILSLLAVKAGDWRAASTHAQRAIDLNEGLPLPWNYLGIARYNLGQRGPALDAWKRSLQNDPKDFDVLYNYAIVAAESGQKSTASSALTRFVNEAPADQYGPDIQRARQLLSELQR